MTCCTHACCDAPFNDKRAAKDLKRYRKQGPDPTTRALIDALIRAGANAGTLLDVGGGIGALHHELLDAGMGSATHADASAPYLRSAREEAARRGHNERVQFIHADFTDVASDLPPADVVTLDRVVCCYPDFRGLLKAASSRSQRALAMTYPRDTWFMRMGIAVVNFFQRLRKDPFRVFVHPVREMELLLKGEGLQKVSTRRLLVWEMALYQRL